MRGYESIHTCSWFRWIASVLTIIHFGLAGHESYMMEGYGRQAHTIHLIMVPYSWRLKTRWVEEEAPSKTRSTIGNVPIRLWSIIS
jgi:hypothetical protein